MASEQRPFLFVSQITNCSILNFRINDFIFICARDFFVILNWQNDNAFYFEAIVLLTGWKIETCFPFAVIEGVSVAIKKRPVCGNHVCFQDYTSGFHNSNNRVLLTLPLCALLLSALAVSFYKWTYYTRWWHLVMCSFKKCGFSV